jgi:ParB/RepB/Spo0J family partition protein
MANKLTIELNGRPRSPRPRGETANGSPTRPVVRDLPVDRIRPEEGLGRKRDRAGHDELCQSIRQFGVLTPVTVRPAPDGSGDYLLVKGQGRTLACRRVGLETVPAIVVGDDFGGADKVQQFLVENVARLKMRPIDRALLISHARSNGEETASVARRFGISAATVRKLEAQLDGATSGEIAALRAGDLNLSVHAVIARFVPGDEREDVIRAVSGSGLRSGELTALFTALGWPRLVEIGADARASRLVLMKWACAEMAAPPRGPVRDRLRRLAERLPVTFAADTAVGVPA